MSHQGNAKRKSKSGSKKWVAKVSTDSTHPPEGLFTRSAAAISESLASKRVSPKGPSSGMRMLNYFINRAGENLSATRRRELEKAKKLLSEKINARKIKPRKIKAQNKSKDSGLRKAA